MKKITVLSFLLLVSLTGFSQVKMGLRLAPGIAMTRAQGDDTFEKTENSGASVRFSAGPIADFFFAENYAFTTGLWYTVKRSAVEYNNLPDQNGNATPFSAKSSYNLQYLQIPVALKFYTNEVATDLRVYFQLGGTLDVKLAEKARDEDNNFLATLSEAQDKRAYKPIDAGLLLGAGAELVMGANTAIFGGLTYNRGLVNSLGGLEYNGSKINNSLKVTNSLLGLEVGLKF